MSSTGDDSSVIEVDSDPAATDEEEWGVKGRSKGTGRRTTRPAKEPAAAAASASSRSSTRDRDDSGEDGEAWSGNNDEDDDDESSYEDEDERRKKGRRAAPSAAKKRGRPNASKATTAPVKAPPPGKAVATKATKRGQLGAAGSTLAAARAPSSGNKKSVSDLKPAAKAKEKVIASATLKSAPPAPSRRKLPIGGGGAGAGASADVPYGDMDVLMPVRLPLECGILMQLAASDDGDATNGSWELDGATGAVGRLEVDANGVILDLKGSQYRGTFFPCATAMILTVVTQRVQGGEGHGSDVTIRRHVKLDGTTDEFCRLVPTGENALDQMSATVHGNLNDYDDDDDDYDEYEYGKHVTDAPHAGGGGRGDSAGATASSGLDFPPAAASSAAGTPKRKPAPASSAKRPAPSNGKGKATPKASKRKAS